MMTISNVNATPSARRYARENGVNLAEVSPKTNDVVRKEDIDKKQQAPASTQTTQQAPAKEEKNTINILQNQ